MNNNIIIEEKINQYFDELLELIQKSQEKTMDFVPNFDASVNSIFNLTNKNYNTHKSIIESNEYRATSTTKTIIKLLLDEFKIDHNYCVSEKKWINMKPQPNSSYHIVFEENNEKVGIILSSLHDAKHYASCFNNNEYTFNKLKLIILIEPDDFAYDIFISQQNSFYKQLKYNVELLTIKEFLNNTFPLDIYSTFIRCVNRFNSRVQSIIGFNSILNPTPNAIKQFKNKIAIMLKEYNYNKFLPSTLFEKNKKILFDNYIDKELYKLMVSENTFAISFITSEWNYQMYNLTEDLDLTNVVAGYLKSIEQLLYKIIESNKNSNVSIRSKAGVIINYNDYQEKDIDTTLGSLENALRYNQQLFEVNYWTKTYIVSIINEWRDKHRNGFFHRDNLQSLKKVDEIREKAIYLYFLILGSSKINFH